MDKIGINNDHFYSIFCKYRFMNSYRKSLVEKTKFDHEEEEKK